MVKRLPQKGIWVKVSEAAVMTGMARSSIAKRYLTGAWDSVMYNKMIHVRVPFDEDDLCTLLYP